MIGTDPGLDLPALSDTMAQMVAKTRQALADLADSIADKATPAAININSALSFQGNQATNVASVTLVDGGFATGEGSIYYHNGSFYAVDGSAAVKLTDSGNINITATGAIGGDYGGGNPATVTFD